MSKRLEAKAERIISQKPIKIRREEKSDKTGPDKQRERRRGKSVTEQLNIIGI